MSPVAGTRLGRYERCVWSSVGALFLCASIAHAQTTEVVPKVRSDSLSALADTTGVPQRDISDVISKVLGKEDRIKAEATMQPTPGLALVILPTIGYNPAYGAYIGLSGSANGWLGEPAHTRVSVFALGFTYSTSQQTSLQFKSDAWVPGNKWNYKGDWRYLDTSQPTYGLGPLSEQTTGKYPMNFVMWRLYQTAYVRMGPNIYFGPGYHLNIHDHIEDERANAGEQTPFTIYSEGPVDRTVSSGLSANVLIDSRDSPIYATKGFQWNASLRGYVTTLGSDKNWQELLSDFRAYPRMPTGPQDVLAIWNTLWMTFGPAPYLDTPAVGWDTFGKSARGYVQGRLRAPNQMYTELEYRKVLSKDGLWGATVFLNGTSSTMDSGTLSKFDPGAGVGLRIKFIKRTRTNFTLDFGWGNSVSSGVYFGTGEYF